MAKRQSRQPRSASANPRAKRPASLVLPVEVRLIFERVSYHTGLSRSWLMARLIEEQRASFFAAHPEWAKFVEQPAPWEPQTSKEKA